jgi:transcription elongation factor GreA
MDTKQVPVTRDGLERLKAELEELRQVRRPQIIAEVAEARSHGDLRENSAYDAARHDQAMNEKRIADLEIMLRYAVLVDEESAVEGGYVRVGATVVVDYDGEEETYRIVGAIEAKPSMGLISNESPMGQALLGKRPGQEVYFSTPAGRSKILIKRIES